jgi:hypothetical protein
MREINKLEEKQTNTELKSQEFLIMEQFGFE